MNGLAVAPKKPLEETAPEQLEALAEARGAKEEDEQEPNDADDPGD